MKQPKVNIRKRIVLSTILVTLIFIIFVTPFIQWIYYLFTPPAKVKDLQITISGNVISLIWDASEEVDLEKYSLEVDDKAIDILKENTEYTYTRENTGITNLTFYSEDIFGNKSEELSRELKFDTIETKTIVLNNVDEETATLGRELLLKSFAVSFALLLAGLWVIQVDVLKLRSVRALNLAFYPAFVLFPILLLSLSFIFNDTSFIYRLIISLVSPVLFILLSYFLFLTVNILNNSLYYDLPLEQAAKASQFIFSLIASYIVLVVFYSGDFNILLKLLVISLFMFYYCFASISLLKDVAMNTALIRSLSITLVMLFAILVLSMWPVNYVYIILSAAVIFYILLSIGLETRPKISNYIVFEYSVLIALITGILIVNASWGILGTLL